MVKRTKKGKENWNDNNFQDQTEPDLDTFKDGIRTDIEINQTVKSNFFMKEYITWKGSATVVDTTTGATDTDFLKDGVRHAPPAQDDNEDDAHDDPNEQGDAGGSNNNSVSPADLLKTPSPGEEYAFTVNTGAPYSSISLYSQAPWQTIENRTNIGSDIGYGTETEASFSFTFPSGVMHIGDFLITAVIYRYSDLLEMEATYTVTVKNIGIYPVDSSQVPAPGDTYEVTVVTPEPYSSILFYLKSPCETSARGSYIDGVLGDGTSNETPFSYSLPSGNMNTGWYVLTAVATYPVELDTAYTHDVEVVLE